MAVSSYTIRPHSLQIVYEWVQESYKDTMLDSESQDYSEATERQNNVSPT